MEDCFFKNHGCKGRGECGNVNPLRIINASKDRDDTLHKELERNLQVNPDMKLKCHKTCVSSYTSVHHIKRSRKRHGQSGRSISEPPTHKRRSDHSVFEFKKHCLFCGELCLPKDPKHPSRWRVVYQCRTVDRPGKKPINDSILEKCEERGDKLSDAVRSRVLGATSDLHAADAQYHADCHAKFFSKRNMKAAQATSSKEHENDLRFTKVVESVYKDPGKVWNSVDLYNIYAGDPVTDETCLGKKRFLSKVQEYFGDRIIQLRIDGCASLWCLRDHLPVNINLVEEEDYDEYMVQNFVKIIEEEVKELPKPKDYTLSDFTKDDTIKATSKTLLKVISQLISSGNTTRKSLALSQCIQAHIQKTFNQTSLGIAVKLHHRFGSKELIELLHDYGITCTYGEVLRFKASVAKHIGEQDYTARGLNKGGRLISSWCDNYDLKVFTPNGMRETHAMVVEWRQQPSETDERLGENAPIIIPRLSKPEMNDLKLSEMCQLPMIHYNGPRKPKPPSFDIRIGTSYSQVAQSRTIRKAMEKDCEWMISVLNGDKTGKLETEWSGYMAAQARQTDVAQKATKFVFGPLIDAPPTDPDTVLTTMTLIKTFAENHEQTYSYMEADMQIYRTAMHIKWSDPYRWRNMVITPGGMHTLMSFLGSIGCLMQGTGLETILNSAYGGVTNMLNGKAWPKAMRGLRMVVVVLLEEIVHTGHTTLDDIYIALENACEKPNAKLWVDCLVTPVIIAHLFIRAERTGDWRLHLYCLRNMVCYFWAAGHWQYAKYITWHIIEMGKLLGDQANEMFLMGDHVCRHKYGTWNAVFGDQFGEQTYIRYGKAKGGLVGLTLSQDQVANWVLSQHVCNMLSLQMDEMFEDHENLMGDYHKEEGAKRKRLDAEDRNKLRGELRKYTHPLKSNANRVVNIVTGRVASEKVNVNEAVEIGRRMASEFTESLPAGFHSPVHSQVRTMQVMKKGIQIRDKTFYNMEKLYGRLLVISQTRNISLEEVFKFELAPLPSSLFDEFGLLRKSVKSVLTSKLCVLQNGEEPVDVLLIDGNELLYHANWPRKASTNDLYENMIKSVKLSCPVYIIFDKYFDGSVKSHERLRRAGGQAYSDVELTTTTQLPARDVIMNNDKNKTQIINLLCSKEQGDHNIQMIGEEQNLFDHEEADVSLISYTFFMLMTGVNHVQVRCDDTDIFILLLYYCWNQKPIARITMKKFDGTVININESSKQLGEKCKDILALHALTGCDSTSYPFGKGKNSGLSVLQNHDDIGLEVFGEEESTKEEIIEAGTRFFAYLYGSTPPVKMNSLRHQLFSRSKTTPSIKSLPPTDEALQQHLMRSHMQVMIWKSALEKSPTRVKPTDWGWELREAVLSPVTGISKPAPNELMKIVACGCGTDTPCSRKNCSCKIAGLSCTTFCNCGAEDICNNCYTEHELVNEDESDINDDGV